MQHHDWYFLTNYAFVLIQVRQNPDATVKLIADHVGITERAVHRILAELTTAGYITRRRVGRKNSYTVRSERQLRHPLSAHLQVGQLIEALELRRS